MNDVVLAVCAGALRRFLIKGNELPDKPLLAVVPVSVRTDDEQDVVGSNSNVVGSNRVSAMFTSLPTDISDPVERLYAIRESTKGAKEEHNAVGAEMLQQWSEFAAPNTFSLAMRLYSRMKLADRHPRRRNLGERALRTAVAVADRVLRALLVVQNEVQREQRAARPRDARRVGAVADQVARRDQVARGDRVALPVVAFRRIRHAAPPAYDSAA